MKKIITIIMAFALVTMSMYGAMAAITNGQEAVVTESNEGTLITGAGNNNITAEGGNVSTLNLASNSNTARWQGFVGNVTGSLALGRGLDVLFDFGASTITAVFATQSPSPGWATVDAATSAQVDSATTGWGYTTGDDQANNVYTDNFLALGNVALTAGAVITTGGLFETGVIRHEAATDKESYIFGANVKTNAVPGFDGGYYQYELMVPSDGVEEYQMYLEI